MTTPGDTIRDVLTRIYTGSSGGWQVPAAARADALDALKVLEQDQLREAAERVATAFTAEAEDWNDGEFALWGKDDLVNAIVTLRSVLAEVTGGVADVPAGSAAGQHRGTPAVTSPGPQIRAALDFAQRQARALREKRYDDPIPDLDMALAAVEQYEAALREIGMPSHVPADFDPLDWWQHTASKKGEIARDALGVTVEELILAEVDRG